MSHPSCDAALHAARRECTNKDDEEACLRSHGILVPSSATTVCPNGAAPVQCLLSGHTRSVYACLSDPTARQSQTVYGIGMRGGPSKTVVVYGTSEKSRT